MLTTSVALHCLARCGCINAAISTRAMQEIGLLFALEPDVTLTAPPRAVEAYRRKLRLAQGDAL